MQATHAPSLDETLPVYVANMERVRATVAAVEADHLDLPTPCTEWNVRDLLGHIVGGMTMFGTMAAGGTPTSEVAPSDVLGADPIAAYDQATSIARDGFGSDGAAQRTMPLPVGSVPGEVGLLVALADLTVHGWDLAKAIGRPADIPEPFLGIADQVLRGAIDPDLRRPDGRLPLFDPPVALSDDATPTERLIAFTGRRP